MCPFAYGSALVTRMRRGGALESEGAGGAGGDRGEEVMERARSVTFPPERRVLDDSVQFDG
jgi:hypothetical protein